jgi:hypothetical protein
VTAVSPSDLWAVGLANGGTLALHWNGSTWTQYPIATANGYFDGTASTSAKNVWAVGTTDYGSTLIVHWNGSAWS